MKLGLRSGILVNVRTCSSTVQHKVRARSCVTSAAAAAAGRIPQGKWTVQSSVYAAIHSPNLGVGSGFRIRLTSARRVR